MLPLDEILLDEFHCALAKTILLQGRLSVFSNHVCFYSNILGFVKQKVIPISRIKNIRKRTNYGFQNSIQIVWNDEANSEPNKIEFFTSFLKRDYAYKLIIQNVRKVLSRDSEFFSIVKQNSIRTSISDSEVNEGTTEREFKRCRTETSFLTRNQLDQPNCNFSSADSQGSSDEEGDEDDEGEDQLVDFSTGWGKINREATKPLQNMLLLMEQTLDNITSKEFADQFLSDSASLYAQYHGKRGDSNLNISPWRANKAIGYVRDLVFVTPLKYRIGPKQTECSQVQRASFYQNEHLVFETSQVMLDIPFGDAFKIETRWDITNVEETKQCKVVVYCQVPFSKRVFVKSTIQGSAIKELKENQALILNLIKEQLNQQPHQSTRRPSVVSFKDQNQFYGEVNSSLNQQSRQQEGYNGKFLGESRKITEPQQFDLQFYLLFCILLILIVLVVIVIVKQISSGSQSERTLRDMVNFSKMELQLVRKRLELIEEYFENIENILRQQSADTCGA